MLKSFHLDCLICTLKWHTYRAKKMPSNLTKAINFDKREMSINIYFFLITLSFNSLLSKNWCRNMVRACPYRTTCKYQSVEQKQGYYLRLIQSSNNKVIPKESKEKIIWNMLREVHKKRHCILKKNIKHTIKQFVLQCFIYSNILKKDGIHMLDIYFISQCPRQNCKELLTSSM